MRALDPHSCNPKFAPVVNAVSDTSFFNTRRAIAILLSDFPKRPSNDAFPVRLAPPVQRDI